jgi:hypothetical protein
MKSRYKEGHEPLVAPGQMQVVEEAGFSPDCNKQQLGDGYLGQKDENRAPAVDAGAECLVLQT